MAYTAATAILCVGTSHKTASVAARERFALPGAIAARMSGELLAHPDVLEIVPVDTCNRSELYVVVSDVDAALPVVVAAYARHAEADAEELATMLTVRRDRYAIEHLFRVAAGVESVVIGEAQIQGQVKVALESGQQHKTVGMVLDKLFRSALQVGKRVRTETSIGAGRASIGSVAVELIANFLGTMEDRRALIVGAGTMSSLAARSLHLQGIGSLVVANRNAARAAHIAEQCGGGAVPFEALDDELVLCDVVVCSTSAPHVVLTHDRVNAAMQQRAGRPLCVVDLAVPRDVATSVGSISGCHLVNLDDLEHVVGQTIHIRTGELVRVDEILDEELASFEQWKRTLNVVPAIASLHERAEGIRRTEFERFAARLAHLAAEDRGRVEQLTRSIVNKLLHEPTVRLRQAAADAPIDGAASGVDFADALQELFGLPSAPNEAERV